MSRLEALISDNKTPPVFEVDGHQYLLDWILDYEAGLGPVRYDGMGNMRALGWEDITHFRINLKLEMTAWEAQMLKMMSANYLRGYQRGTNPLARSPLDLYEA